ncbi:MAG: hypothetical protein K0R38_2608, partial [Polyangiaceae bacterium]|nr:hypothetical protein [Polyangiaceae bacterium]
MATPSMLSIDIRVPDGTSIKSLESLRWESIPGFVVLTGANGSGKTQLLDFLAHKLMGLPSCSVGNIDGVQVRIDGKDQFGADAVAYIPSRWEFSGAPSMDIAGVQNTKASLWTQLTQHGYQHDLRMRSLRARLERLLEVSNLATLNQSDFSSRLPEDLSFLFDEKDFTSGLAPIFLAHRL